MVGVLPDRARVVAASPGQLPEARAEVRPTEDAVTGASGIPVGYATLALVYLGLAIAVAWLLRRLARSPFWAEEAHVAR